MQPRDEWSIVTAGRTVPWRLAGRALIGLAVRGRNAAKPDLKWWPPEDPAHAPLQTEEVSMQNGSIGKARRRVRTEGLDTP